MTVQLSFFQTNTPAPSRPLTPPTDFLERPAPAIPAANLSLNAAINRFTQSLFASGKSKHTIRAYNNDLRQFALFAGGNVSINTVSPEKLNAFLRQMQQTDSPKTLERRITSLRSFFTWLTANKTLRYNPASQLQYQPLPVSLPRLPSQDEMKRILNAAKATPNYRSYALLSLCLETGIKKGELMRLALGDITRQGVVIRYTKPKTLWKSRRLPVSQSLLEILWQYREANPKTDVSGLWFPFAEKTIEVLATTPGQTVGFSGLTVETLRWLYAVKQSRQGTPPDTLRENLGLSPVAWHNTWKKIKTLSRVSN